MQNRKRLNRDSIAAAALTFISEVGLDGFSMRQLAQRLNVQSPALYWHFRSREELLGEAAEIVIMSTGMGPPETDEAWQEWVRRRARSYRQALTAQRDGARIVASARGASAEMVLLFNQEVEALAGFGFTPAFAIEAIAVITHFVSGFVLKEQADAEGATRDRDGAAAAMQTFIETASPAVKLAFASGANPLSESVFAVGVEMIIAGTHVQLTKNQSGYV
jgi:TetR/AcrR family tetracycline transcriptional repressor